MLQVHGGRDARDLFLGLVGFLRQKVIEVFGDHLVINRRLNHDMERLQEKLRQFGVDLFYQVLPARGSCSGLKASPRGALREHTLRMDFGNRVLCIQFDFSAPADRPGFLE
jgi:hypothetical protein